MKNILILNFTRVGDLVQTTNMLSSLKGEYPESRITLLANKRFEGITSSIPFIDDVRFFDIIQFENKFEDITRIVDIYQYIDTLIEELRGYKFDMAVNLSHSKLSAVIVYLSGINNVVGIMGSREGHRIIKSPWLNYYFGMVVNREFNLFNIVDMYTKAVNLKPLEKRLFLKILPEDEIYASGLFESMKISDKRPVVGFQLGSSRIDRRWPVENFAKLAGLLINNLKAVIILFGTKDEQYLGDKLKDHIDSPDIVDLMGKTSLSQMPSLLKLCSTLITNDTGTMHIAAAVDTKVIALFFAHALYPETGPYGVGHIVIQTNIQCSPCSHQVECRDPRCLDNIIPDDLYFLTKMQLDNAVYNQSASLQLEGDIKVFYPGFDDEGFIEYLPLFNYRIKAKDIVRILYKDMWRYILDNCYILDDLQEINERINLLAVYAEEKSGLIYDKILKYYTIDATEILLELRNKIDPFKEIISLAEDGIKVISKTVNGYKNNASNFDFKSASKEIDTIDEKIEYISLTFPVLSSIYIMFKYGKENQTGNDILLLADCTIKLYTLIKAEAFLMTIFIGNISNLLHCNQENLTPITR